MMEDKLIREIRLEELEMNEENMHHCSDCEARLKQKYTQIEKEVRLLSKLDAQNYLIDLRKALVNTTACYKCLNKRNKLK